MPWERSGHGPQIIPLPVTFRGAVSLMGRNENSLRPVLVRPYPWDQGLGGVHKATSILKGPRHGLGPGQCSLLSCRQNPHKPTTGQQLWALNLTPSRCPEPPVSTVNTHSIPRYTHIGARTHTAAHTQLRKFCIAQKARSGLYSPHPPFTVSLCLSWEVRSWVWKRSCWLKAHTPASSLRAADWVGAGRATEHTLSMLE